MLEINENFDLSSYEIKLLDLVATAHLSGEFVMVGDLINRHEIASRVTLHAALKSLIGKNLLRSKSHSLDVRAKKVLLTKMARQRYERISKEMRAALLI